MSEQDDADVIEQGSRQFHFPACPAFLRNAGFPS
jgi:hypothetical protein